MPRDMGPPRRLNREMDLPIAPAMPQETTPTLRQGSSPAPQGETASVEAAPVLVSRPAHQLVPVIFASPHSGRTYPADFLAAARLDPLRARLDPAGRFHTYPGRLATAHDAQ